MKIEFTIEQLEFLEAALEKAMDNECDPEYYEQYDQLIGMVRDRLHAEA